MEPSYSDHQLALFTGGGDTDSAGLNLPKTKESLMSLHEFKARNEAKMISLLQKRENRELSVEKVQFLLNNEYEQYVRRNLKPDKSTFAVSNFGTLIGGQKLNERADLSKVENVRRAILPAQVTNNNALKRKAQLPKVLAVTTNSSPGKELVSSPPCQAIKLSQPDFFDDLLAKMKKSCAHHASSNNGSSALLAANNGRVEDILSSANDEMPMDTLVGPLLMLFTLQECGLDKMTDILEFDKKAKLYHEGLFVDVDSLLGPLNHAGLYCLITVLAANFPTEESLYHNFRLFLQGHGIEMESAIDKEFLTSRSTFLKEKLGFFAKFPKLSKNPRFAHQSVIAVLAKIYSIGASSREIARVYVNLQELAVKAPEAENEKPTRAASRLVLRTISRYCDTLTYVQYGTRQLSNQDMKVLLLPKSHVVVIVDKESDSSLTKTIVQMKLAAV